MHKQTLIKATEAGAKELKRFFNGKFKISNKEGINNLVTEADHAADRAILKVIHKEFPTHGIVSEESVEKVTGSEYRWIIDPIDGTVNFANGIPICCVSIGLEHNGNNAYGSCLQSTYERVFFRRKG